MLEQFIQFGANSLSGLEQSLKIYTLIKTICNNTQNIESKYAATCTLSLARKNQLNYCKGPKFSDRQVNGQTDPAQTTPKRAVPLGSTLFAILSASSQFFTLW